jgi:hypothetical protein
MFACVSNTKIKLLDFPPSNFDISGLAVRVGLKLFAAFVTQKHDCGRKAAFASILKFETAARTVSPMIVCHLNGVPEGIHINDPETRGLVPTTMKRTLCGWLVILNLKRRLL